jgi:16S rRNA pseudouridine516 synthase
MRLDKYISYALNLTRSEAKSLIRKGKLEVNGKIVQKTDLQIDENKDVISFDDQILGFEKNIYLMMNKPIGYLSSRTDGDYPSILNLVSGYEKYNLFIAGRLDLNSEGLLLLTNDGELTHRLTSPNYHCPKKYYVLVEGVFSKSDVEDFFKGMMIKDGKGKDFTTKPARLEIISPNEAYVTIYEGKFHQVRRMCSKVGKEVKRLIRMEIGNLKLDLSLNSGEYRVMKAREIESLKKDSHN